MRNVKDDNIRFTMNIKRFSKGNDRMSRISPVIWESFFHSLQQFDVKEKGCLIIFIEVEKPRGRGLVEMLGLGSKGGMNEKKTEVEEKGTGDVGVAPPEYAKES